MRLAGPHGPVVAFRHPRAAISVPGAYFGFPLRLRNYTEPSRSHLEPAGGQRDRAIADALPRADAPSLPEPATRLWPTFQAPTAATSGVGSNVPSGQQQEHDNPASERGDKCAIAAPFASCHPKVVPPSACHPRACPEDPSLRERRSAVVGCRDKPDHEKLARCRGKSRRPRNRPMNQATETGD